MYSSNKSKANILKTVIRTENLGLRTELLLTQKTKNYLPKTHILKTKDSQLKTLSAFTLVELIVVIVILAILATIAFLSFSSQSSSARDSTRLTDMSNIAEGLGLFNVNAGKYPNPDNSIAILSSGTVIGNQGYAGASVLNMIKISNGGKDPLDNATYYTYSTNATQSKYQILGFLEDGNNSALSMSPSFIKKPGLEWANADTSSYSGRFTITKGDQLGILLSSGSMLPVQTQFIAGSFTGVDVTNSTTSYSAIFDNKKEDVVSGTGAKLNIIKISYTTNVNPANMIIGINDPYLAGYWDMETIAGGKLIDLSGKGNQGVCLSAGTVVNCDNGTSGPIVSIGNGKTGKSMKFDGNDWINVNPLNITGAITVIGWFKRTCTPVSGYHIIFTQGMQVEISIPDAAGQIRAGVVTDISSRQVSNDGSNVTVDGNWNLTTMTYDGTNLKSYINGQLVGTHAVTGQIGTGDITNIGMLNNTYFTNGYIDEIKVYKKAMTDSEILNLYNSSK